MLTSCNTIMLFVFVLGVGPVISHTLAFIAALACPGLMPLRVSSHIPDISRYGDRAVQKDCPSFAYDYVRAGTQPNPCAYWTLCLEPSVFLLCLIM
jgi:hypothetical protein